MLIYAKNLNRGPINSKLSEALRSSFLGLRGGRHAVEQFHLTRSRQGPCLTCSKSRQKVEILNLHHHVCNMVDRATLHYVTGTFPEINDKLIQLIKTMFFSI